MAGSIVYSLILLAGLVPLFVWGGKAHSRPWTPLAYFLILIPSLVYGVGALIARESLWQVSFAFALVWPFIAAYNYSKARHKHERELLTKGRYRRLR